MAGTRKSIQPPGWPIYLGGRFAVSGTIVYIDDVVDLPTGLENELGRLGFRLQHTDSYDQALSLVREGLARIVMLEVQFEAGRGWGLIDEIRMLGEPTGDVPIIIYTQQERTPTLYSRAIELGANDFLARPVLRAEVLGTILECAETSAAGALVDSLCSESISGGEADATGSLADFPLADLLLNLREVGATGVLSLQDFEDVSVQLRNGSPIGVSSSRSNESFTGFLVRTRRVTDFEYERILERASKMAETEAEAAVAIGALSAQDARAALANRVSEPLLEAFGWTSGAWRFEPKCRIRSGSSIERGGTRILAEGVLEWTRARTIRAMLDRRGAHYLSKLEYPPLALDEISPSLCDAAVLDDWAGDRTVAEILESGVIAERELYALLVAGFAESHETAPLELTRIVEEVLEDEGDSDLILDLEEELPPDLETDAVSDSVGESTRIDEPEGVAALEAASVAGSAEAVKRKPDGRASTPRASTEAPSAPAMSAPAGGSARAEKLREAERHFMEGETHLEARRYDDATAAFGMAAHLDPDQGEYRSHLGYAMHLQRPATKLVTKEALEHIANGIKRAPEQWRPSLFLARVFIATGEGRNARRVLATAARKHPDCEPILVELRKLEQPLAAKDKTAGLGGRLRSLLKKS
jgi:CheY-like chemotaxis protein